MIRCRFCSWEYTSKKTNGDNMELFQLRSHVRGVHRVEATQIRRWLLIIPFKELENQLERDFV